VFVNASSWPTQQQVTGSIIDADVTLFEVCQLLEYLSQRQEKKESQTAKKNELSLFITAKGKKGKRANGQSAQAKCKHYTILNTHTHTHTHTHTRFQNNVFSVSLALSGYYLYTRAFLHTSHTHRHTHVLSLCLSLVCTFV
jgi:hypothetical protein